MARIPLFLAPIVSSFCQHPRETVLLFESMKYPRLRRENYSELNDLFMYANEAPHLCHSMLVQPNRKIFDKFSRTLFSDDVLPDGMLYFSLCNFFIP